MSWSAAGFDFSTDFGIFDFGQAFFQSVVAPKGLESDPSSFHPKQTWMSLAALVAEVQALTREVADLRARVLSLENQLLAAELPPSALSSPITVNYVGGSPYPELPPFPTGAAASQLPLSGEVPSPNPSSVASVATAGNYTEAQRIAAAEEVGKFLARALRGDLRGDSGRSKLRIPSRVYLLVKDVRGRVYDPVQIHRSWASIAPLVKERGHCGDSVFVGLPTLWEAKIAVVAGQLNWPADDSSRS